MLQLELERSALPIAAHEANGDERQQERRRELAGAEGRRPDADQRRERFADARRRAVQPAGFAVGAHGTDEARRRRGARSRSGHHPPRARREQLAPFLRQRASEARRYVSARKTSSRSRWPSRPFARRRAPQARSRVPSPQTRAAAEQHEAIADAGGVRDLMNRQEQRAPATRRASRSATRRPPGSAAGRGRRTARRPAGPAAASAGRSRAARASAALSRARRSARRATVESEALDHFARAATGAAKESDDELDRPARPSAPARARWHPAGRRE